MYVYTGNITFSVVTITRDIIIASCNSKQRIRGTNGMPVAGTVVFRPLLFSVTGALPLQPFDLFPLPYQ